MRPNYIQIGVAFALTAWSALECVEFYPHLPDPMATNFGGDGAAGGRSSKALFLTIGGISMAVWFGMLLAMPRLAARSSLGVDGPTRLWLRDASGWFMVASLGFSVAVMHLVFEANLTSGKLSNAFGWLLALYMGYLAIWTIRLVRRWRTQRGSSG